MASAQAILIQAPGLILLLYPASHSTLADTLQLQIEVVINTSTMHEELPVCCVVLPPGITALASSAAAHNITG